VLAVGLTSAKADATGNIVGLTNTAGQLVATYSYSAFGRRLTAEGPAAALCPFGFQTRYNDADTGLMFWPQRVYR
jgi:YD repeat-containing protein